MNIKLFMYCNTCTHTAWNCLWSPAESSCSSYKNYPWANIKWKHCILLVKCYGHDQCLLFADSDYSLCLHTFEILLSPHRPAVNLEPFSLLPNLLRPLSHVCVLLYVSKTIIFDFPCLSFKNLKINYHF